VEQIQISVPDSAHEMRFLIQKAQFDPDEDERKKARKRMREVAAAWHGFPGQRRRGDLPEGVEIR
jgi:hypothetical protein